MFPTTFSSNTTHATCTTLLDGSSLELLNASIKFSVFPYCNLFVFTLTLPFTTSISFNDVAFSKSDNATLLIAFGIVFNFTI